MSIQQENLPWEYGVYQQLFEKTSQSFTPAYMHGLAWAILITVTEKGMVQIPFFQGLTPEELGLFKNLYEVSTLQLRDPEMGIVLLLPEDNAPLSYRLEALVDWCEGFLHGIQLAETCRPDCVALPESREILKDIEEISGLHCDEISTQDNERHYLELIEFMRVAVLLLEASLNQPPVVLPESMPIYH